MKGGNKIKQKNQRQGRVTNSVTKQISSYKCKEKLSCKMKSLKKPQQEIISKMQKIMYGKILNIDVVEGLPKIREEITTYEKSTHCSKTPVHINSRADGDFLLKDVQIKLLQIIDEIKYGNIHWLTIQDGLPMTINYTEGEKQLNAG